MMQAKRRKSLLRVFNVAMFVLGCAALWWLLRNESWRRFAAALSSLGWSSAAVLITLDSITLCCNAAALHTFMRPQSRMVSYLRVLGAQASAHSINTLTPGLPIGVATKFTLLVEHMPRARVLSSIVLLNLTQLYLSVAVLIVGIPITLLFVDLPHELKLAVGVVVAALIPVVVALGLCIRRGALRTVVDVLRRTRIISAARADQWHEHAHEVDAHIRELHRHRSAGTWHGIAWLVGARASAWSAALLLVYMLGVPLTPALVIGLITLGILVTWLSALVPFGVGLADGGSYGLFLLLGATGPQGLLVAMVNRARSFVMALLGLVGFGAIHVIDHLRRAKITQRLTSLRDRRSAASP
jgi:uncharacterized membrane protein YbhN (UPF0104 family)